MLPLHYTLFITDFLYDMLCYYVTLLCNVMLCYAMLSYAMLYYKYYL